MKLKARQTERDPLVAAIGASEAVGQLTVDRRAIERKVREQIEIWTEPLSTNGRQLLRDVLDGPLQFAQEGKRYRFAADVKTGAFIAGLVGVPPCMASPRGCARVGVPDTFIEGDSLRDR